MAICQDKCGLYISTLPKHCTSHITHKIYYITYHTSHFTCNIWYPFWNLNVMGIQYPPDALNIHLGPIPFCLEYFYILWTPCVHIVCILCNFVFVNVVHILKTLCIFCVIKCTCSAVFAPFLYTFCQVLSLTGSQ